MSRYEVDLLIENDNYRDGIRYIVNKEGTILDNRDSIHINESFKLSKYTYENDLEGSIGREWCRASREEIRAYSYAFVYYKGELKSVCIIDEIGNVKKYDADTFFKLFDNLEEEAIEEGRKKLAITAIDECRKDVKKPIAMLAGWTILVDIYRVKFEQFEKDGCTNEEGLRLLLAFILILTTLGVSTAFVIVLYSKYKYYKKRLLEEETNEENKKLIKKNAFKYAKDVLREIY